MKPTRIIALLLALVMLLGVFASCELIQGHEQDIDEIVDPNANDDPNPGDGGSGSGGSGGSGSGGSGGSGGGGSATGCEHFWILGVCRLCSAVCSHEWGDGICKKCDYPCNHTQQNEHKEDRCSVCREEYTRLDYNVSVLSDGDTRPTKYTMDIAMSIDELCAHFMPTWIYIFRHKVLDIKVNGEAVSDFTKVINSDIELKYTAKSDALRITVTDGTVANSQEILLPAEGITMKLFGALLYPTSGGFDHLLQVATVMVDDVTITDASYKVDKNCTVYVIPKSGTGGGGGSTPPPAGDEKKEIHVTVENLVTGEYYEGKPEIGIELADAFKEICGLSLDYFFENGIVYLNGEQIYESMPLEDHSSIQFAEVPEGHVVINFNGTTDLGVGEAVNKRVLIEKNCTFEIVIQKAFNMTWEEYENSFYNTRITDYGDYTTWIPVYRDTEMYDSLTIYAIRYKPHEKTENVTLTININGIINDSVTVAYDTPISVAFGQFNPPLNFEECLEEWDMFFNVYSLVSDAKLKYDSFIYGSKLCTGHKWVNGKCTECGANCTYIYYEGACPICQGNHPSEDPNIKHIVVEIYTNSGVLIESHSVTFYSSTKPPEVLRELGYEPDQGYVYINGKFDPGPEEYSELFGGENFKFYLIDDTDICYHSWGGGVCSECGAICEHVTTDNGVCTLCYASIVYVTFTVNIRGNENEPEIYAVCSGSTLFDFATKVGYTASDVENGYFRVDGEIKRIWFIETDCHISYYIACNHTYVEGVCSNCGQPCEHQRHVLFQNLCTVCGMDIGYPETPPHEHEWENSQCKGCLEWCNTYLSHTFVAGVCTNCGCSYHGPDHYVYLEVEGLYDDGSNPYYYIHYNTTLTQFLESIKNSYTPIDFTYHLIDRNNSSKTVQINENTIIGEFGSSLILSLDRHYHSWHEGVCTDCGYECPHPKADDFCPECGMDNPYNLITIMYNGVEYKVSAGFELSTFVERIVDNGVWFDDAAVLGYWVFETEDSYEVIYMHDTIEQSGTLIYIERTGEIDPNYCSHNWRDSDYCKFCGAHKEYYDR